MTIEHSGASPPMRPANVVSDAAYGTMVTGYDYDHDPCPFSSFSPLYAFLWSDLVTFSVWPASHGQPGPSRRHLEFAAAFHQQATVPRIEGTDCGRPGCMETLAQACSPVHRYPRVLQTAVCRGASILDGHQDCHRDFAPGWDCTRRVDLRGWATCSAVATMTTDCAFGCGY